MMSSDHHDAEDEMFGPIGSRAFGGGKVLPDGTYRPRHPFDDEIHVGGIRRRLAPADHVRND